MSQNIAGDDYWYEINRLDIEIDWYDKKAITYKKWYKRLFSANIIISALIPFVTIFSTFIITRYIIALMGSIITIISGFLSTFQIQRKWVEYRNTKEKLTCEKYLFKMNVPPYNLDNKIELLVRNTESIISKENIRWTSYNQELIKKLHENKKEA